MRNGSKKIVCKFQERENNQTLFPAINHCRKQRFTNFKNALIWFLSSVRKLCFSFLPNYMAALTWSSLKGKYIIHAMSHPHPTASVEKRATQEAC